MRSNAYRVVTAVPIVASVVLSGCSSGSNDPAAPASSQHSAVPTTSAAQAPEGAATPGAIAVSPNGVTTSVDAPAESTEDEYFQACHGARLWMAAQPGDAHAQVEPYLAMIQGAGEPGPGTFNTPWPQLSPGRQAAVIVAAQAAADELCG